MNESNSNMKCPAAGKCGGCSYTGTIYEAQLKSKQKRAEALFSAYGHVDPIIGMDRPEHYRNKVHHVFGRDAKGNIIHGTYREGTHKLVDIPDCLIEDEKCQEIIRTIKGMLKSFKIKTYDEDTRYGLLRHVLVRRGFSSGEIMVVLVLSSPVLPGKNDFIKVLRKAHPEITTVIINVNDRRTGMVLGKVSRTVWGPGFIRDTLCGARFRISPSSFYQVNPVQTEKLYGLALEYAALTGCEEVLDAYCGIGTIGICAAPSARHVTGVELNPEAVKDAVINARENGLKNIDFIAVDATEYMERAAADGHRYDVIFMDPPRSGSTERFIKAAAGLNPSRIVYVSCGPDTLARDLEAFAACGYKVKKLRPVDMFPYTEHIETIVLLQRENS